MSTAILVTGSRDAEYDHWAPIVEARFRANPGFDLLIHGSCEGIDEIAERIARKMGFTDDQIEAHPYLHKYGRAGGPIRNAQMVTSLLLKAKDGKRIRLEAFHSPGLVDFVKTGKGGTYDCLKRGLKTLPPYAITYSDETGSMFNPSPSMVERLIMAMPR